MGKNSSYVSQCRICCGVWDRRNGNVTCKDNSHLEYTMYKNRVGLCDQAALLRHVQLEGAI